MQTMKTLVAAGALLLAGAYSSGASALALTGSQAQSLAGAVPQPASVTTSGCAASDYCTLAELASGGVLHAGSLSFANFTVPFAFGLAGDSLDAANVAVRAIDFGFAVVLTYDYAPLGFGGPLPTLVDGGQDGWSAAWDIAYQVSAGGGAQIVGAGIFDMGGAGLPSSNYLLQVGMAILGAGGDLADLNAFLDVVGNQAVDSGGFESMAFQGETLLDIYNAFSHLASSDLSLLAFFDQVFFVEQAQVPAPGALALMLVGLALWRRKASTLA